MNSFAEKWQDYCLPDKTDLIKPQINEYVVEIDKLLEEQSKTIIHVDENKKEKAKLYYIKGKILDLIPVYEKSSEELLNKSVINITYVDKTQPPEWRLLECARSCFVQEGRL